MSCRTCCFRLYDCSSDDEGVFAAAKGSRENPLRGQEDLGCGGRRRKLGGWNMVVDIPFSPLTSVHAMTSRTAPQFCQPIQSIVNAGADSGVNYWSSSTKRDLFVGQPRYCMPRCSRHDVVHFESRFPHKQRQLAVPLAETACIQALNKQQNSLV